MYQTIWACWIHKKSIHKYEGEKTHQFYLRIGHCIKDFFMKIFSFLLYNYIHILKPKICHIIASVNMIYLVSNEHFNMIVYVFHYICLPFVFRPCWIWGCPLTWRTAGPWPPSTTRCPTAPVPPVWRCCYKREPL